MRGITRIFLLIILFASYSMEVHLFAQNGKVDSLLSQLKKERNDTNKVNTLTILARTFSNRNPDTSIILGEQALLLSENLKSKKHIAESYHQIAWTNFVLGNYPAALENNFKALKLREEIGDKSGLSKTLGNIGIVYNVQGDYPKALDYYLRALKLAEELKNKNAIAADLGNIGNVYKDQNDYENALSYYLKALKISEETKDKYRIANNTGNIGIVYHMQGKYSKALFYYFKSLQLEQEMGNEHEISKSLGNIGSVYKEQGDSSSAKNNVSYANLICYPEALKYYFKALKIKSDLGDKSGVVIQLGNIGSLYVKLGKYNEAFSNLYRALAISDSIQTKNDLKDIYEELSALYEKSNLPLRDSVGGKILNLEEMRVRALHYYKSYLNLRDTIFSQENKKQMVQKEMNFEFEKKEAAVKAEQDRKDVIAQEELKQKERERNYFITGFALVILLAVYIFRGYRQKQTANEIISLQKSLVEEKQKEILDSIHYAKRIQQSLLPTEKYIQKNLNRLKKN